MEMPRRFDVEPPRRVLVVGGTGSGRRALAEIVARDLGLPFVDAISEGEGDSEAVRLEAVAARSAEADWAMAAGDHEAWQIAVKRAEWFVWLDLPLSGCIATIIRRAFRARRLLRAGSKGLRPPSTWTQVRQALNFPVDSAPKVIATVERERRNRSIFILRSKRDVREFIEKLPRISGLDDKLASGRKPGA